ncbi:MAG: GalNAc-alpha-(1-_4)-GalNAc-alpha-(1-_3)-diNAcBac-PP-undecaprenol alpha-1,4-N-acetyl-D-galactosaminyltransferase [Bacteroidetes bacterium ADurb.Bin302]|nr:MAG: GalNAc-alpha-(1->4)-GalNAc-alpha-(1->3)-diNAcBac-PP-undecaprenol alpha-1,4-N-acetyl-D-galactosaminyltransferase [Bacteroidetes bacterium ADurb.Bin302]
MNKVFFTCNRLGYGGAERVICSLCNEMANYDIKSSIVCLDVIDGFHYKLNNNVTVVELNKSVGKRSSWFSRKLWGFIYLARLFSLFKKERPDIVCSFYSKQNCYSILCAKLLRIPVVCSERDSLFLNDGKVNHLLRSIFYKYADGFIHQTKWSKEYLEYHYKTNKDSIVLSNPLWIKSFPERKPLAGYIIAVGRLTEQQKNFKGLIRGFIKASQILNSKIQLSIFGEGPSKNELESFIVEQGAQDIVFLKGQIDNVLEEYSKAEMFVLFSHGEGYPNVLLEAMACGVPCISSDCPIGGPASMIENGENGILVENENEDDLTQAIVNLHNDEALRKKLSEKAIEIRANNSMDIIYKAFYQYMEHVCNKRQR